MLSPEYEAEMASVPPSRLDTLSVATPLFPVPDTGADPSATLPEKNVTVPEMFAVPDEPVTEAVNVTELP